MIQLEKLHEVQGFPQTSIEWEVPTCIAPVGHYKVTKGNYYVILASVKKKMNATKLAHIISFGPKPANQVV